MNELSKSNSEKALQDIKEKIISVHEEFFEFDCRSYEGGIIIKVSTKFGDNEGLIMISENICEIAEKFGLNCDYSVDGYNSIVSCTSIG